MRRLVLMFVAPGEGFKSLAHDPRWVAAFVATLVVAFAANVALFYAVGLENVMRAAIGSGPEVEDLVRRTEQSVARQLILYVGPVLTTAALVLGVVVVFLAAFTVVGVTGAARPVLAVTAHAFFVYYALSGALMVVALLLQGDPTAVNVKDPLVSSLGDFLDRAAVGSFLFSLASSVDLFSLICVGYLIAGFRATLPELRTATIGSVVLGLWGAYVVIKAAVSAAFAT